MDGLLHESVAGSISSPSGLTHQAVDAADRLQACPHLWERLSRSSNLKKWLGGQAPAEPTAMIRMLMELDSERHEILQKLMRLVCKEFKEAMQSRPDPETCSHMEQAAVALYLLCICRLIEVKSSRHFSGIPSLESDHAVNLFAILIAATMTGGKLVVKIDEERKALVPKHAYAIQFRSSADIGSSSLFGEGFSISLKDQFERGLYLRVMHGEIKPEKALDVEPLTHQERSDLTERLLVERLDDDDTNAMCIVLFGLDARIDIDTELARSINIPVFHSVVDPDIAYTLLGGLTAERFISKLNELLRAVREDVGVLPSATDRQLRDAQLDRDRLGQRLRELLAASPEQLKPEDIRAFLEEFERAEKSVTPQQRDILNNAKDVAEKFSGVADATEKLVPRMIQVLDLLSKLNPF